MSETTTDRRWNISVEATPGGLVALVHVADDDDLDSLVITFTPGVAAKLGQRLISVANRLEPTP